MLRPIGVPSLPEILEDRSKAISVEIPPTALPKHEILAVVPKRGGVIKQRWNLVRFNHLREAGQFSRSLGRRTNV